MSYTVTAQGVATVGVRRTSCRVVPGRTAAVADRRVRLLPRLEIGVLGLEIIEHFRPLDLGIAGVAQPGPGILDCHPMMAEAVLALLGLGRRRKVGRPVHGDRS